MSSKIRLEQALSDEQEVLAKTLPLLEKSHCLNECTFLYDLLIKNFDMSLTTESEKALLLAAITVGRRTLYVGNLTLFRGHKAEAFVLMRRAIEYTLFACHAMITPGVGDKWLQANQNNTKYDSYRSAFPIIKMLKKEHWTSLDEDLQKDLVELIECYDHASKLVHATLIGGVPKIVKNETQTLLQFPGGHVDSEIDTDEILRIYATCISDHGINIRVLAQLMAKLGQSIDIESFKRVLNDFGTRLLQEIETFK